MYKTAISNAKDAGETGKVRRYDRGLKVTGMELNLSLAVISLLICSNSG